jgi:hypothetical protein
MSPAATLNAPMMIRRDGAACHGMIDDIIMIMAIVDT